MPVCRCCREWFGDTLGTYTTTKKGEPYWLCWDCYIEIEEPYGPDEYEDEED